MTNDNTDFRDSRLWWLDDWRQPPLEEDEESLFHEPGRIIDNTDYRSHAFRLVKPRFGNVKLCVRHGGGDERILLDWRTKAWIGIFSALAPDDRYLLMHSLLDLHRQTKQTTAQETSQHFRQAFAEGRLKKRKMPGRDACKIWIEPKRVAQTACANPVDLTQGEATDAAHLSCRL